MYLNNKKILTLVSGEYFPILKKTYMHLSTQLNSEVFILTDSINPNSFKDAPKNSHYMALPDLYTEQDWEKSEIQTLQLKEFIGKCELEVGIPISRIILMNERSIGRAYSKNKYYWQEKPICKKVLVDLNLPYIIIMRSFKLAQDILEKVKPDFIMGGLIGGLYNSVFYYLASYFKIPILSCVESVLLPDRHTWVSNWGSYPEWVDEVYHGKLKNNVSPSVEALQKVHSFREKPQILPVYARSWSQKQYGLTWVSTHKAILDQIKYRLVPIMRGVSLSDPKPFWQAVIDSYRTYINIKLQNKYYKSYSENQLEKIKYIYYPMHMEPEYVLNTRATSWYDQLNTIRVLSYNLPIGYRLLVKEHRYNFGRKSNAYLKSLVRYPGIDLIDPFDDQFKYIKNSALVITVNGTTGFEALLLKKPVITLSRTFYDCMSLDKKLNFVDNLGQEILSMLNHYKVIDDYDKRLGLLLDAEFETTLAHDAPPQDEIYFLENKLKCIHEKKKLDYMV